MSDINKVLMSGRLGRDPEVRYMPNGNAVTNLSLASSEKWKDKSSGEMKERTEWSTVVFYGRTAEVCGEYLTKGSHIMIEGRMQTRKWQDKDGNDRYTTEIVGSELHMLSKGRSGGEREERADAASLEPRQGSLNPDGPDPDDDIPF